MQAAAAHRTLDPEAWDSVIEGVGGLDAPLEQIRRRGLSAAHDISPPPLGGGSPRAVT